MNHLLYVFALTAGDVRNVMRDREESKEGLIQELEELCAQIAGLRLSARGLRREDPLPEEPAGGVDHSVRKPFGSEIQNGSNQIENFPPAEDSAPKGDAVLQDSSFSCLPVINGVRDVLQVGICMLDRDFRIAWMNKSMEDFFELDRDSAIG